MELDLSACDLATLSACNTARGQKRDGEGGVGRTWALSTAGIATQVISQWAVDNASMATLMARFHTGIRSGQPKGASLRDAE